MVVVVVEVVGASDEAAVAVAKVVTTSVLLPKLLVSLFQGSNFFQIL